MIKVPNLDAHKNPELLEALNKIDDLLEINPKDSLIWVKKALVIAETLEDFALISMLNFYLGSNNLVLWDSVAIENFEIALSASEKCQRLDLKVDALYGLGMTLLRFGEISAALKYSEKALELAETYHFASLLPKILISLAIANERKNKHDICTQFLQQAISSAKLIGDNLTIAKALNTWANNLIHWHKENLNVQNHSEETLLNDAIKYASESLQICRNNNYLRTEIMVAETLAHALECHGQFEQAKALLIDIQSRFEKYDFVKEMLDINMRMGIILLRLDHLDESISILENVRNEAKKLIHYNMMPNLLKELCLAYELKKNYHAAFLLMKEMAALDIKRKAAKEEISAQVYVPKMELEQAQNEVNLHKNRVGELEFANRKLHSQAFEDLLTGLPNRRSLDVTLVSKLSMPCEDIYLVMCDIDFFKKVNDNFSHVTGDEVLRKISQLIRHCLRPSDYASRYGGEEFAIILDQCRADNILDACERIRITIRNYDWESIALGLQVTMSFGVTSFQKNDNINSLILRADNALYSAKKYGRNRIELNK